MGHRCNWIRLLISRGFIPSIQLLGEVDGNGSREEIAWIKYFKDEGINLVNDTTGGEGITGFRHSLKTRLQIGGKSKGRKVSVETRQKISNALSGRVFSEERRKKIGEATRNRSSSKEYLEKLSQSHKGCSVSPETRQKLSKIFKGRIISEETRQKMREGIRKSWENPDVKKRRHDAAIGKTFSVESREKMSKSAKRRSATEVGRKHLISASKVALEKRWRAA